MKKKEHNNIAVFAGGCFWCTEAVFKRLKGVTNVTSGYTGGDVKNPAYREICTGKTGHAEAVKLTYSSDDIAYEELLEVFFATHNPTTLNRQGNDIGTQYRSAIFYTDESQRRSALGFIDKLKKEKIFQRHIVTEVMPLTVFYEAEDVHQDYYDEHINQPYCQLVIQPKLKKLNEKYTHKLKNKI
ncbi:peptide-methionine (S)-S-oxide reductase MsrA [Leptobacterium sp. I13]|uniref:peptide-methionine (S)-S-oxide reductase MsrA n=1 Tax=Leptobacterium meishanense TaxID=3128904 RepID=UPI0030EDDAF7